MVKEKYPRRGRKPKKKDGSKTVKNSPSTDSEVLTRIQSRDKVILIQELIPIGLMAFAEILNRDVESLLGSEK